MELYDGDSGDSTARVVNERVYVAVGSDVQESKLTLLWALQNFGGHFRIIYVHSSSQSDSSESQLYGDGTSSTGELVSENVNKILDEYVHICNQAKVPVEKRWIDERDTAKGIVELIELHAVTKLVMGAAADKHYNEEMRQLKSTKARFVNQHAHPSCYIWFICKGHLIYMREGDLSTVDMDVVGSSWVPVRPNFEARQTNPTSPLGSVHSTSYSSEVEDDIPLVRYENGEGSRHRTLPNLLPSYEEDRQLALLNVLEGSGSEDLYEQLEKAMAEAANAKREAFEELIRRQKAEKNAIEATLRAKKLENLYSEQLQRTKELEEILAQQIEGFESIKKHQAEDLLLAEDQRMIMILESQIAGSDRVMQELDDKNILLEIYKKEKDELQVQLENALKVNEELLTNQGGEPSTSHGQQVLMEFSFLEIQEATENFNPSLKIEEGDYGSIYKGILRHISVSIKMLQAPSQYHLEVEVMTRLRHPNLVNLIGVCPDASALVYEHLPNGNLEDRLNSSNNSTPLSWQRRISICTEICAALIFLHSCQPHRIVHGDLKPGNVLLDANVVSKLRDFGIHHHNSSNREDDIMGELSVESDVYSFGAILLRLLTGRSDPNLATEIQDALNEGTISALLDSTAGDWPFMVATQLAHLALSCCEMDVSNRPDLRSEVWDMLDSIRACCEAEDSSSNQIGSNDANQPPAHFICPILQDVMKDPLVAADGFTYEAEGIRGWIDSGHDTSPMTNLQLEHMNLTPNQTLRSAIQEWLETH